MFAMKGIPFPFYKLISSYSGSRCDTQATGGSTCESSEDCGNGVGGICNPVSHTCECYKGWTCPSCDKIGSECNALAQVHGGGSCETNADCGNFGPDKKNPEKTGGKCEGGMCVCFEGYTCPHCTTEGTPEMVVEGDLICKDAAITSVPKVFGITLIVIVLLIQFIHP